MTWLSFCARRPGPEWKQGYGTGDRTLAQIEGVVDHSMEGYMAGGYSVLDGPAQSSWTFSLPKIGEPVQHYPLEKITWHCGLPGDRKHDTSLIGNLTLVGKEHEGVEGEPWTENQTYWSARIDVALRQLCPAFGANPTTLRLNQWEHNWLSATSCPSNRNLWEEKFSLINEWEEDMAFTAEQEKEIRRLARNEVIDAFAFAAGVHGATKPFVSGPHTLREWLALFIEHKDDEAQHDGGVSYTDVDAVKAVKDKLA